MIKGVETFVALLRNLPEATPRDVEIYFQDYDKLIWKLKKIDAKLLDINLVQKHREELGRHAKTLKDESDADYQVNKNFLCIFRWGQQFCEYAIKVLQIKGLDEQLAKFEAEKVKLSQDMDCQNEIHSLLNELDKMFAAQREAVGTRQQEYLKIIEEDLK